MALPKRFVDAKECVVQDAIDGLLYTCSPYLNRLDGYPNTKVILRRDWDKSTDGKGKVALVCGAVALPIRPMP